MRSRTSRTRAASSPDGVPRRAARAPRGGAEAGRRVPRRGDPSDRHRGRAGRGPRPGHALAARRNLAAFLDEVHGFEPVEGELTLRAFLEYVDAVEALDKQDWAPVQPSDEDSVKVMTIHVAKGLEFDHVFVPGVAHGLLPNPTVPQNPAERGKSLDFELRGDAAILPTLRRERQPFQGGAGRAGDRRGTPHRLRRAHACTPDPPCERGVLVRRQPDAEEGEPLPG